MKPEFIDELETFIALSTIAGDKKANALAIDFLRRQLEALGFHVVVEGASEHSQPVIVARNHVKGMKTLVLYNHYDVEPVKDIESWDSPPFQLTRFKDRLVARGIADNKAVLLARLFVMRQKLAVGETLPDLLWLIQGEEEVGGQAAFDVFPKYMKDIEASVFLEETGYNRDGVPLLFHYVDGLADSAATSTLVSSLNEMIFDNKAKVENRRLSKFGRCPFVSYIPSGGHYIGFGPNDYSSKIHQSNESLDVGLLADYLNIFGRFLNWYQKQCKLGAI